MDFFTSGAKKIFIYLEKVFIKIQNFYHFKPECYIFSETDTSNFVISEIFSQLILD